MRLDFPWRPHRDSRGCPHRAMRSNTEEPWRA
jgi:hypothetical protein